MIYGLILIVGIPAWSQKPASCLVLPDTAGQAVKGNKTAIKLPGRLDSASVSNFMAHLYAEGYLEAKFRWVRNDSSCSVLIAAGEQYHWLELTGGNLPDYLIQHVDFRSRIFGSRIFNFKELVDLYHSILKWSENNGYPFSAIGLNRLQIVDHGIRAGLHYNPGPFIEFDTISVTGTNRINPKFLSSYLGITPGDKYNRAKVISIPTSVMLLRGIELTSPPEEYFAGGKCYVRVILKEVKANGFDGYIGLLPNENSPGKLLVTGQLRLALNNLFRSGKSMVLNWQRPDALTQELDLSYEHPCIFNTPVGGTFDFNIFKQDTTYLKTGFNVGFDISNTGFGKIGIHTGIETSRVLRSFIPAGDTLFRFADINISYYGIHYSYIRVNDPDFPISGWTAGIVIDAGIKRILDNGSSGILKNGKDNRFTLKNKLSVRKYTPLGRRSTVIGSLTAGTLNDNNVFYSDLYRLGGLGSLRGFNEKYFYASKYILGNFEYRLRIEQESYLLLFTDLGMIDNTLNKSSGKNWPIGIGTGFNIATPLGNLAVIYALGKDNNRNFNFKYSKIHIGYVSRF